MHETAIKSPVDERAENIVSSTEVKIPIDTGRSKSPFSESLISRWDNKQEEVTLVAL